MASRARLGILSLLISLILCMGRSQAYELKDCCDSGDTLDELNCQYQNMGVYKSTNIRDEISRITFNRLGRGSALSVDSLPNLKRLVIEDGEDFQNVCSFLQDITHNVTVEMAGNIHVCVPMQETTSPSRDAVAVTDGTTTDGTTTDGTTAYDATTADTTTDNNTDDNTDGTTTDGTTTGTTTDDTTTDGTRPTACATSDTCTANMLSVKVGAEYNAVIPNVESGKMKDHTLYQINSMNNSGISNKSIHVTSRATFKLQVLYKRGAYYVEGFLAIPEENLLGPRNISDVYAYVATTFCAIGGFCQIGISTFKDATSIDVKFPKTSHEIVFCRTTGYFRSHRDHRIFLKKFESVMFVSASDLTGTHIYSFHPISVFVGTRNLTHGGLMAHMVEQLHPMSHWGTEYIVRPLGENGYGDILKISTQWDNTLIKMKGYQDFVVTNRSHNVWRRLDKGISSHIKASKPIQVVQITGLAYGSTSDTQKPGMVVVPAIENGEEWFVGTCGKGKAGEFHVVSDLYYGATDTHIDNHSANTDPHEVDYTLYRVENITVSSHTDHVYNISNTNKLRGIVKCQDTAVMALGLVHQDPIPTDEAKPNNPVLCRVLPLYNGPLNNDSLPTATFATVFRTTEMVMGTTNFDPRISQNARHEIKFDPYKIMLLRLRTCGTFFIQFLQDLESIGHHVLVSITRKSMLLRKCEPNCQKATKFDTSSYNGDFDCKTDMQLYWFNIIEDKTLCYGHGPFFNRSVNPDCITPLTAPITRALMIATPGKAIFNYDLETKEDCDYRYSEWRCEDKNDICAKYGKDICTQHVDYAQSNCPKLCKFCSPDNYGRKFISVIPQSLPGGEENYFMYVSGYRVMPNIAVGTSTKLIKSEKELSDDVTKVYNVQDMESKHIFVFADADVSVTILFGKDKIGSYMVYPVDNFGTEYFPFFKDEEPGHCFIITEYSSIDVTQFGNELMKEHDSDTFQVGLSIVLSLHWYSVQRSPLVFLTSRKPFILYCGRRNDALFHQILPTHTWGTNYYVPAFEANPSDFPFDLSLYIMAQRDNTVVKIDGDFNAIHVLSLSGDTKEQPITGSDTYTVSATHPIGLGIVFADGGSQITRYFHVLPPSNAFLSTQVNSVPVGILLNFADFPIASIKSYHVDVQPSSVSTYHTVPNSMFLRNVTTTIMHGIYVVESNDGQYFSLSGQRQTVNKETSEYCHTSLPVVGDSLDNDCDGLNNEDTCYLGYGAYSEDYDLDGGFSDDCCVMDPITSIIDPPMEPACLEIQKPANQCWTNCQLDCEWVTSLENYEKLTEEEKEALHAAVAEKQKKDLVLNKKSLSASTAQKTSAEDDRLSATGIGYVGIGLFTIVFGTIFIMDISSLVRDILITCRNIKEGVGRFWNYVRGK